MIKEVAILGLLILFLISVIIIYNARNIIRYRLKAKDENSVVSGMKVVGCFLLIISLYFVTKIGF